MADFKIEVPISVKGDTSGKKFGEGIAEQIKKTLGSIGIRGKTKEDKKGEQTQTKVLGIIAGGVTGILAILGMLKPVMKLLQVIMVLLFWPLIPYFKKALIALADFAGKMKKEGGGITGAIGAGAAPTAKQVSLGAGAYENIGTAITGALVIAVGVAIAAAAPFVAGATIGIAVTTAVLGAIILFAPQIAEGIINSIGEFWSGLLATVLMGAGAIILFVFGGWILLLVGLLTAAVIAFLPELKKFGSWLWNAVTSNFNIGLSVLKNIGQWIMDKITAVFGFDKRAGGGSVSGSRPYLVGENGPEIFAPGTSGRIIPHTAIGGSSGQITIQINNPSVRNDMDIKKIANQVSKVLQRQMSGRMSQ